MHMSKQGVYDQLTADAGEKFTADAAQYAIDNVQADWNANALATAKQYQATMSMSPAAIHDQLTSDAGEKFTQAEADYAIAHLND
ncbi:Phage super infection exclusion [Propionibacterium freudenreichii]|nr:Phage super infection exclusion [Propionibacterium freudenreichii]